MIIILILENIFLYIFFSKLDKWLDEKRIKKEEEFYKKKVRPLLDEILKNLN